MALHLISIEQQNFPADGADFLCANAADGTMFRWSGSPSKASNPDDSTFGNRQHYDS